MLSTIISDLGLYFMDDGWARFGLAFIIAFFVMTMFGTKFIHSMHRLQKKGQPIRKDGPQTHLEKQGTPTMGGILLIIAILAGSLLSMEWSGFMQWIALFALVSFGAIGFADDFGKIKKNSAYAGLSAKLRLGIGFLLSIGIAFAVNYSMPAYLPEYSIAIPGGFILPVGTALYFLFAYLVIAGSANATNITDGLDGMLAKIILPIITVLTIAVFGATNLGFFETGVFIPEAVVLYPLLGALAGALLGFLWFNGAPASIFMGDVGSLAIGGMLGTIAMLLKVEIVYGIAALMMVIILASTFLQILVYKLTKKRLFLMAPLHHHFEQKGWSETKISERFFILSIVFGLLALGLLKI